MTESLLQSEANQTLETHKKNQAGNIAIANVLNGGSYSCFERLIVSKISFFLFQK